MPNRSSSLEKLIYLIVGLFFLNSCSPPLYIPNTTNTPSLLRQGDTEIGISTGSNGWDGQFATAVTNNFSAMLNGSYANQPASRSEYNKHHFLELGLGYTYIFNKEALGTYNLKYFFSGFAGGGAGSSEGRMSGEELNGDYSRFFIQPSIGFTDKNFDVIIALRTSWVNFTTIKHNQLNYYQVEGDYQNIFYEPTFTFKAGAEHFKFFTQVGFSIAENQHAAFRQRPIIFIIGIQGNLNWK